MIKWLWLRASWLGPCRCGDKQKPHTHYRPGTECALCDDCLAYRPWWWWHGKIRV